jgi:hypothetical protein
VLEVVCFDVTEESGEDFRFEVDYVVGEGEFVRVGGGSGLSIFLWCFVDEGDEWFVLTTRKWWDTFVV